MDFGGFKWVQVGWKWVAYKILFDNQSIILFLILFQNCILTISSSTFVLKDFILPLQLLRALPCNVSYVDRTMLLVAVWITLVLLFGLQFALRENMATTNLSSPRRCRHLLVYDAFRDAYLFFLPLRLAYFQPV